MENLRTKVFALPAFSILEENLSPAKPLHLSKMVGSLRAFVVLWLFEQLKRPVLYVAEDIESAEKIYEDLGSLGPQTPRAFLPGLFAEPYANTNTRPELVSMRLDAMQTLLVNDSWITVATQESMMEKLPLPETFVDAQIYLKVGNSLNFDGLQEQLTAAGFERTDIVEQVGEYSVRGGIVDVYAWNNDDPLRIEFFGETIESMRSFDVITQRTSGKVDEADILPHIVDGAETVFLNTLLPAETILFFQDAGRFYDSCTHFFEQAEKKYTADPALALAYPAPREMYCPPENLKEVFAGFSTVLSGLVAPSNAVKIALQASPHPDFAGNINMFLDFLKKGCKTNPQRQIVIQSHNESQAARLRDIIEDEEIPAHIRYSIGSLEGGFLLDDADFILLTDHEIFKRFRRHKPYRRFKSGAYLRQLGGLNVFDYVVHVDYGIGQYLGLDVVNYGVVNKECLKIAYSDGDMLYVSVDRLNRVQKYSSEEAAAPKLTKLGTPEWSRARKKTEESLKKVAAELIQLYAGRKAQDGFAFAEDNHWQNELEAGFEFEETDDQLKAISALKKDMGSPKPMDRLLCGDVGFGKTEVALRGAFKAVMSGKQVALLAPTTLLTLQHYQTFKKRLEPFPVVVEMLNRFRTPKQQKDILERLALGKIDIVVGTHRLLSGDIQFKDLGLLIVDEEQRFGVRHKEKLKSYRLSVDILAMSATPIPRTLHMALMGARDFSNIETPPLNRLPIHTEIIHWEDRKIFQVIQREIERGGQVYFVHNRVQTIDAVKQMLEEILPKARIGIGHGQLPERQLEKVMIDFMDKKYDILLASMIIENGLDIPNANTIIINRADKFGLSQLYQLRGRVGRSARQAYAYLLVPPLDKVTELSRKRLRTIQDFTDLGSGYKVALRDLEIRGAGNLLGKQQSGYVQTVGFDLYCRILEDAVKDLRRGLSLSTDEDQISNDVRCTDPKLDMDFDLLIPEDYIRNELERVSIYHRLMNYRSVDSVDNLRLELRDRFGPLPEEVSLFLEAVKLKALAGCLYAARVILNGSNLSIIFDPDAQDDDRFFKDIIPALRSQTPTKVTFLNQKDFGVRMYLKGESRAERIDFAKKVLQSTTPQG